MIYFFLLNLIIIVIKKVVQPMGSTRPMWVGLDLCDELGWIEFFFLTHHGGLGQKIPLTWSNLTWPMHTPTCGRLLSFIILTFCFYPLLCSFPSFYLLRTPSPHENLMLIWNVMGLSLLLLLLMLSKLMGLIFNLPL